MKASLLVRRADFYLSLAFVLVCTTGAVLTMQRINAVQERSNLLGAPLEQGSRFFEFKNSGRCVGVGTVTLHESPDDFKIDVAGSLHTELNARQLDIALTFSGTFNVLGQLGAGILDVRVGPEQMRIGLFDTDPIAVKVRIGKLGTPRREYDSHIPGPIELKRLKSGRYSLSYRPLASMSGMSYGRDFLEGAMREVRLDIVSLQEQKLSCLPDEQGSLDLTAVSTSVRSMFGGLITLLGKRGIALGL